MDAASSMSGNSAPPSGSSGPVSAPDGECGARDAAAAPTASDGRTAVAGLRERYAAAIRDRLRQAVVPEPSPFWTGQIGSVMDATEYDLADVVLGVRDAEVQQLRAEVEHYEQVVVGNLNMANTRLARQAATAEAAVARARAFAAELRGYCTPHGISALYADRLDARLDGRQDPA